MKNIVEQLLKGIEEIIFSKDVKNKNQQRFELGKYISNFYVENKKVIQNNTSKDASWQNMINAVSEHLKNKGVEDGYSASNLGYMQRFYKTYRANENTLQKALLLNWSHNVELLQDKLTEEERFYYLKKAIENNWSVKELKKQIKNESYDEFLNLLEQNQYHFTIDKYTVKNYKSLVNVSINPESRFLVFAGANATGKSSVFEALEFLMHVAMTNGKFAFDIFGGTNQLVNYKAQEAKSAKLEIGLNLSFGDAENKEQVSYGLNYDIEGGKLERNFTDITVLDVKIVNAYSRIFIDNYKRAGNKLKVYNKLWLDAANLSDILAKVLAKDAKRDEIIEWLQIFIPEIDRIEVEKDLAGKEELKVYEKTFPDRPFTGSLISEGTYNIIALLVLLYQADEPQFICIEEPETGLNPAILSELVPFFRKMTEKYHHHIWLTTHSTALVAELNETELAIVSKENGQTIINQCKEGDFVDLKADEAWLSRMLKGGGIPW